MDPRRILVVQLRRIGDVILTMPASSALKRRYPSAKIDMLVEGPGSEVARASGLFNEVVVYDRPLRSILDVRSRRYDMVVDFMGNPRTALLTFLSGAAVKAGPGHVFHSWAYGLKLPQSSETVYAAREKIRMLAPLGVPDEPDALPVVAGWAGKRPPENRVGLFPGSRKDTRRWPADSFAELGRLLRDRWGAEVVVFWGPGEKELAESVVKAIGGGAKLSPNTRTLEELARALSSCRLVVSNCAGPKHVAVAVDVPTLTIHGSSDPKAWTPVHPKHKAVRRDELHCIGCRLNDCPYALECLEGLPAARVFEAAEALLGKARA